MRSQTLEAEVQFLPPKYFPRQAIEIIFQDCFQFYWDLFIKIEDNSQFILTFTWSQLHLTSHKLSHVRAVNNSHNILLDICLQSGQVSHCHCSCPDPLTQPAGRDTLLVAEAGLLLFLLIGVNLAGHEEHIVGGSVIPEHGLLKCLNYYIACHRYHF